MNKKLLALIGVVAAATVGFNLTLRAESEAPATELKSPSVVAPGRVEPAGEEREIGARMPGLLQAVHVDENDVVKAGAILAEIDRTELEAERKAVLASIELKAAQRARIVNGAREQERQAARARVAASEAALLLARQEHARVEPLAQSGVLTPAELDRATSSVKLATAQTREAEQQLSLLRAAARTDDVRIADAELALAQARLIAIDAAIEKSYVRAPVAGTVLKRYRRQGEMVSAQPPSSLFVLGDLSQRTVRAEVDELDVARVHVGDSAFVVADGYPGQRFVGRVTRVGQRVGGKTVTTDRPEERQDRKVLDVMVELAPDSPLAIGLRVDVFITPN